MEGLDGVVSSPEELAEIVEDKIFEKNKQTNPKYKAQVRSRVFNLKDKKNPSLRENVLCGTIKPEKLAVMTSEEMASDEVSFNKLVWNAIWRFPIFEVFSCLFQSNCTIFYIRLRNYVSNL